MRPGGSPTALAVGGVAVIAALFLLLAARRSSETTTPSPPMAEPTTTEAPPDDVTAQLPAEVAAALHRRAAELPASNLRPLLDAGSRGVNACRQKAEDLSRRRGGEAAAREAVHRCFVQAYAHFVAAHATRQGSTAAAEAAPAVAMVEKVVRVFALRTWREVLRSLSDASWGSDADGGSDGDGGGGAEEGPTTRRGLMRLRAALGRAVVGTCTAIREARGLQGGGGGGGGGVGGARGG